MTLEQRQSCTPKKCAVGLQSNFWIQFVEQSGITKARKQQHYNFAWPVSHNVLVFSSHVQSSFIKNNFYQQCNSS
jgi:hypothetical protein